MRILCFIDSLGSGGAQRQLVNLALSFKKSGNDVTFLIYHQIDFFKDKLDSASIEVIVIEEKNFLKRIIKIRKFIRSGKFDSIISFLEAPTFICEISGFPYKKWIHIAGERNADPKILKSPKLIFFRFFHIFADYVVANSERNIQIVKKINPILRKKKLKVIYNIVDINEADINIKQHENDSKYFKVIVAARHEFQKNLIGLVEAINLLPQSYKERLKIEWYGGERDDDSKRTAINKINEYSLENIFTFYEDIHNIHQIMIHADAVGLFSLYEGLPNAICEAMFLGKPVISSKVSDMGKFITNQDLLCDPENIQSITNALQYLLSLTKNDLKEIGSINKKIALKYFDRMKITDGYLQLLSK